MISVKEADTYIDFSPEAGNGQLVTISKSGPFKCVMYYEGYEVSVIVNDLLSHRGKSLEFNDRIKSGKWDGVIRYFDKIKKEFPIAFYKMVVKSLISYGYNVRLYKDVKPVKFISNIEELKERIQRWGLDPYPYEHQISALFNIMDANRATIISTTSSGKSYMMYMFFRLLLEIDRHSNILVIVPYSNLVMQMQKYIDRYDTSGHISKLVGVSNKKGIDFSKSIIISTYQAFDEMDKKKLTSYLKTVDAVIVDEVHISGFDKYLRLCVSSRFRIGMTGTINEKDMSVVYRLYKHFGEIIEVSNYRMLKDEDIITPVEMVVVNLEYPAELLEKYKSFIASRVYHHHRDGKKFNPRLIFDAETDFIMESRYKEKALMQILNRPEVISGNTMIFFQTDIPYMHRLFGFLKEIYGSENVALVNGDVEPEDRLKIQEWFESGCGRILVASVVFSTGMSIDNLHNIVCMHWFKSKNTVLQLVGRGMRLHNSKKFVRVWDIVDILPDYRKQAYSIQHFNDRLSYYKKEGYDIKYTTYRPEDFNEAQS